MSERSKRFEQVKLIGGELCLDFVNTGELVRDYDDLLTWMRHAGAADAEREERLRRAAEKSPRMAEKAYDQAVSLRETIRRIFSSLARGAVAMQRDLDRLSATAGRSAKHLTLRPTAGKFRWDWDNSENRLEWPIWALARSAAGLLTSERIDRVRACAAPDCGWLFVDTSRNRSRRWCDMADCGNRAKARRSYARKRMDSPPPAP